MITLEQHAFQLENFEGPLDFLLYLVQKEEVDIYDIPLQEITHQYQEFMGERDIPDVDSGAEFLASAALLLYLKSRTLLPREDEEDPLNAELDPKFEIIHHLLDYCRFKEAAQSLSDLEEQQNGVFFRGAGVIDVPKPSGVDHLNADDLANLFEDLMKRVAKNGAGVIHEEEWKISDKIRWIKTTLKTEDRILCSVIFSPERSRSELIVNFLAVLELMKLGFIAVIRENEQIYVTAQTETR